MAPFIPISTLCLKTFPDWKRRTAWSGTRSWSRPQEEGERGERDLLISVLATTNGTSLPPLLLVLGPLLDPARAGSAWGGWGLRWPLVWPHRGDAGVGASEAPADICWLEAERHPPGLLVQGFAGSPQVLWGRGGRWWSFHLPQHRGRTCARTPGALHGLSPQRQRFARPLQKGLRPPSSANKPLQVNLLGKPGSFINIHNVNCCNLKAGFPIPGTWACAAGVETCGGMFPRRAPAVRGGCSCGYNGDDRFVWRVWGSRAERTTRKPNISPSLVSPYGRLKIQPNEYLNVN